MRYFNGQHGLIASHNRFCLSGNRALKNPIVRIVIEHADTFLRLNEFGKLCQEKSRATQGIGIAAELACKGGE